MPLNTPWGQNGGHGWEDVATSVPAAPKPSGSRAYTMDVIPYRPRTAHGRPPHLPPIRRQRDCGCNSLALLCFCDAAHRTES